MYILFEDYQYNASNPVIQSALKSISTLQDINKKVSVSYVGYFYEPALADCVFILPKVLLNENDYLVTGEDGESVIPPQILTPEGQKKYLSDGYRAFIYQFAVWIYRTLCVYKDNYNDSKAIYYKQIAKNGNGKKRKVNTYLDIILSLMRFNLENSDFFLYTIKNIHAGQNKINWTKTIGRSIAYLQDDTPIYLDMTNKKRCVDFDEELFIIYFSILDYINRTYGFHAPICLNYQLLSERRFDAYLKKGVGKTRLRQIKYKYYSDRALYLWELCYAFFDIGYMIHSSVDNSEYLLARNYYTIFESIIDDLVGENHSKIPFGLQDQKDGKMVDHMYTGLSLINNQDDYREVYYIGDSKYYKVGHPLTTESITKQYTYARNVIQWNIDLWNQSLFERNNDNGDSSFKHIHLRNDHDEDGKKINDLAEGYNIIPNFFISATLDSKLRSSVDNFATHPDPAETDVLIDGREKQSLGSVHISTHFPNRLFDRDTLILSHYDVNFLFVVHLYARNKAGEKASWKTKVRSMFRSGVQLALRQRYDFYAMIEKNTGEGEEYILRHFKDVMGKIFCPFQNKSIIILALEKMHPTSSPLYSELCETSNNLVAELSKVFLIEPCPDNQMDSIPEQIKTYVKI